MGVYQMCRDNTINQDVLDKINNNRKSNKEPFPGFNKCLEKINQDKISKELKEFLKDPPTPVDIANQQYARNYCYLTDYNETLFECLTKEESEELEEFQEKNKKRTHNNYKLSRDNAKRLWAINRKLWRLYEKLEYSKDDTVIKMIENKIDKLESEKQSLLFNSIVPYEEVAPIRYKIIDKVSGTKISYNFDYRKKCIDSDDDDVIDKTEHSQKYGKIDDLEMDMLCSELPSIEEEQVDSAGYIFNDWYMTERSYYLGNKEDYKLWMEEDIRA